MVEHAAQAIDDRQSKAQPTGARPAWSCQLSELGEDCLLLILRNADAAVHRFDAQPAPTPSAADDNAASLCVFDSIRDQVEKNALQQDRVGARPGIARPYPQP